MEFTKSHIGNNPVTFGLVEIRGMRLVGRLTAASKEFRSGMKVRMTQCGIDTDGKIFYEFKACE